MARVKIDYGIDLGTTNSAIARMENGEVKIIKSDTQKDTTPSCVHFRKNTTLVGDTAYARFNDEYLAAAKEFSITGKKEDKFNTFIEFKRTMGSNKTYDSNNIGRAFYSEELSSEVLKALKSYVRDEEIAAAVITVPAKFRNNQIDATQKAAELAGFKYCELLQEPIAASIAYGVSANSVHGYWLVFDFGGGTFDAALMKVDEGIMKVVDTEGDSYLGGKDLDYAIVDNIIIPYLKENYSIDKILEDEYGKKSLRESLKFVAEEAKISISSPSKVHADICTYKPLGEDDNGNEIEIDIKMSLQVYEKAVAPIFQRAIDISKTVIERNNLKTTDLEMVLLVGGPTLSQTLRKQLKEELNIKIDTSIDPMTSVAVGAALFASTKDIPSTFQKRDKEKIQLTLKYPETTVETEEDLGIKIDRQETKGQIPSKIYVEVSRKDKGWSSGKVLIEGDAEIINLLLRSGKSNTFLITLFDDKGNPYPCEPSSFSIIHGFKEPPATLPYDLGIEAYISDDGKAKLSVLAGLEKNSSLPAKGKGVYKTQKDIRPGNSDDKLVIRIFEGIKETRSSANFLTYAITLTGEQFNKFLPKDSEVEITIEVDKSRRMSFTAYLPEIDETFSAKIEHEKTVEVLSSFLVKEITKARQALDKISDEAISIDLSQVEKLNSELSNIENILENGKSDFDTNSKVQQRLREVVIEIDKLEEGSAWPKVEEELNKVLEELITTNERYGNDRTSRALTQFEKHAKTVIRTMDIKLAKELTEQISSFDFALFDQAAGVALDISLIKSFDDDFDTHNWQNRSQAKQLINQAKQIISTNPTKQKLRPIILDLYKLLPNEIPPTSIGNDDEILRR